MNIKINEIVFDGDSSDYHILSNAADHIAKNKIDGLTCEIGLRKGMGTATLIKRFIENKDYRTHIGIDLFGSTNPTGGELFHDGIMGVGGTPNFYRDELMINLFKLHLEEGSYFDFIFYQMDDMEFFKRYSCGVPVYHDEKKIYNKYALVHSDGPHYIEPLISQINFFAPRMDNGSIIIFDDIGDYNHDLLEKNDILPNRFTLFESSRKKKSYIKI